MESPNIDIPKTIKRTFFVSLSLLIFLYFYKDTLPDHQKIHSKLLSQPKQNKIEPITKTVDYKGNQYKVDLLERYEIHGLLVSHNDPQGFGDRYHDETSFDTKDFCLIWGGNLLTNDYQDIDFWNVSITCRWKYGSGISFNSSEISNNHLITDSDEVREQIDSIGIGDQVSIRGYLANYTRNNESFTRKSSLTRDDTGMGACEVIYVESLSVLKRNNRPIHHLYNLLLIIVPGLFLYLVYLFFKEDEVS